MPQDIPLDSIAKILSYVQNSHPVYETPITLKPHDTIARAMDLIHKRSHRAVIIVDDENKPIGIFTESDAVGLDRFTKLEKIMSKNVVTIKEGTPLNTIFTTLENQRLFMAPIVNDLNALIGVITQKGVLRSDIYTPALNDKKQFMTAVAIGVNGEPVQRAEDLIALGVDCIVIDTAHGHQQKMLSTLSKVRARVGDKITVVAGNVATGKATKDLLEAGANIVKVGIGPGAMCTTRIMTGVGRPQFSAIIECYEAAKNHGGTIWADGGVKHPRDVALALAAGASSVVIGSWFAGTYESAADILQDSNGNYYKENYGMASRRAVRNRNEQDVAFLRAKKEMFEEGISSSKLYLDDKNPGVEDILDRIVAGVRSAMTYSGSKTIQEFHEKAIFGIQTAAGYNEGLPVATNW